MIATTLTRCDTFGPCRTPSCCSATVRAPGTRRTSSRAGTTCRCLREARSRLVSPGRPWPPRVCGSTRPTPRCCSGRSRPPTSPSTALGQPWLPVERTWRLNERHYGDLQGLDKKQTAEQYGVEQIKLWRRSYDVPPPPVPVDSPEHPANDPRYDRLATRRAPGHRVPRRTSSPVCSRTGTTRSSPTCRAGLRVLVVAHGNSLRALLKHLEGVSDADIAELNIPTGIPRLYDLGPDLEVRAVRYLGDAGGSRSRRRRGAQAGRLIRPDRLRSGRRWR